MKCCNIYEVFAIETNKIKSYKYWELLLRNRNQTIGNCVAILKRHIENFSEIKEEEIIELRQLVVEIEVVLKKAFLYDKINYQMLMMVDRHLHFHIVPRYSRVINFEGTDFNDAGWPALPQKAGFELSDLQLNKIREYLLEFYKVEGFIK